ncbi:MAG: radical SAM protein [Oscillospiraceae bacterium]|nr:radical SAM protein [Oscillospiraceae bacterium]
MKCTLCPRNCKAERTLTTGKGYCKIPQDIFVGRIAPHYWEEPVISGKNGTAAVFFTGCTLGCIYCQNSEISQLNQGKKMSVGEICNKISELLKQGCETVSFITPTHYINKVKEIIDTLKPKVPVVYNTSGYETGEGIKSLNGYIDIYLPDLKYSSNALGKEYSNADNYFDVASRAIEEMVLQTGAPIYNNENILQRGTVVRNLVLPNHTRNSIEVIEYLSEKYGDTILFSLMGQYIPCHEAINHPKLNRKITKREYQKVLNVFENSNLTGFCQELSSADESYIPNWAI